MKFTRGQVAAVWLAYVTNQKYADLFGKDVKSLEIQNFLAVTGIDPELFEIVQSRIRGVKPVEDQLKEVRKAFQTVLRPGLTPAQGALWEDDSPPPPLLAQMAALATTPQPDDAD